MILSFKMSSYSVMPIITIVILVNIHRLLAYNDNHNDNDYHYSMNSDSMKIIS